MASSRTFHSSENPDIYKKNASFVFSTKFTQVVMEMLDPQPGEVILDLGCGSGELTLQIHEIVSSKVGGRVLGFDKSADMIARACDNGRVYLEGKDEKNPKSLHFMVGDGQNLEAEVSKAGMIGKFDKVFSNAALHWMSTSPSSVISAIFKCLKPNGAIAIEQGGQLNMIGVRSAVHSAFRSKGLDPKDLDPWWFPSIAEFSSLLQSTKDNDFQLEEKSLDLVPRITKLSGKTGLEDWLQTFCGSFFNSVQDPDLRHELVQDVVEKCKIDMWDEKDASWQVMYVRLRCKALKVRIQ